MTDLIRSARVAGAACILLVSGACRETRAPATADQQQLIDLEHHWLAVEDNPDSLESVLAPDFVHVLPAGFVTKAQQLQFMRAHPVPPGSSGGEKHFSELHVRVFGDVGIADGIVSATHADGTTQQTIFTDVFARRDGVWKAVNAQETPLAERSAR